MFEYVRTELERIGLLSIPDIEAKRKKENDRIRLSPFFSQTYVEESVHHPWLVDRCGFVSKTNRFLYCRFPKSANSTVIATLYNAEHQKQSFSREEMNSIKSESDVKLSSLTTLEVLSLNRDYIKFAVARNPVGRIRSSYLDKIVNPVTPKHKRKVVRFLKKSLFYVPSFSEFLDYLQHGNGLHDDAHWAPQIDMMPVQVGSLDYLGKVENLEHDMAQITSLIFGKPQELVTWNPHATNVKAADFHISTNEIRRLEEIYAMDFDLLKYPSKQ